MRLTAAGQFLFIVAPILFVLFYGLVVEANVVTSPCYTQGLPPLMYHEVRGWHDDVKCYKGNVVDFK